MSSRLGLYPAYKDSGVDWLGEVPIHWETRRLKYAATVNPESIPEDCDPDYDLRYVDIGSVDSTGRILDLQEFSFEKAPSRARRKVKHGDTIISTVRTYLRAIAYVDHPPSNLVASTGFAVLRPDERELEPKYLWRLLQSSCFVDTVVANSLGIGYPAIPSTRLGELFIWIPPLPEQRAIASFLDRETAKIDALIRKQERLIELLEEKRAALISHAVTKGLNPDVPTKDSGIPWLGEIPAYWEVIKAKHLFRLSTERAPEDHDYDLLSLYTNVGVEPRKSLEPRGNKASSTDGYWIVRRGDIIVNKLLAWMGAIGRSSYEGVTSPAYDILRKSRPLESKYYHYLFRCGLYITEFRRRSRGIMDMRLRLYFDEFGQILLPYPTQDEQSAIASYLDRETAEIDTLISTVREMIEHLQEYRTALISAAVTGKIDVQEEVPG